MENFDPKQIRPLIIVLSGAWGGLERTALIDAELLQNAGIRVRLLLRAGTPIEIHAKEKGFAISLAPERVRNYFDFAFIRQIRAIIREHNINLIHCHQTSLLGSIAPALWGMGDVALVLSRHILNNHNKKNLLHAILYGRVDYLLVLSQTMKQNLQHTFPIPTKKLRIVNLGLDLKRFSPQNIPKKEALLKAWGIQQDSFVVGVVGRLDPMKGQDLLIKAVAQASDYIPHIHLLIVGEETPGLEGKYLKELHRTVDELQIAKHVSIRGAVDAVAEVMGVLDIFVMPSREEAFGLVALEAMAMGVPCLLSRAGSSEELAKLAGATLFRPGDAFDLSNKIKYLYNDIIGRQKLAQNAKEYVVKQHSLEQRFEKTLELYKRSLRRHQLLLK